MATSVKGTVPDSVPKTFEDEVRQLAKDADDVKDLLTELKERIDKIYSDFKDAKDDILQRFDEGGKTVHALKGHRSDLEGCFDRCMEELCKLGGEVNDIHTDAENLSGALDNLQVPEPVYDEEDIDRLERVDACAYLFVRSRQGGRFEEGIYFDELVRAVEDRP